MRSRTVSELAAELEMPVAELLSRLDPADIRVSSQVAQSLVVAEAGRRDLARRAEADRRAEAARRAEAERRRRELAAAQTEVETLEGRVRDLRWQYENWPSGCLNPISGETQPRDSIRAELERDREALAAARQRLNALTSGEN